MKKRVLDKLTMETDPIKALIEASIAAGRHFQSPQTEFVHYYYHADKVEGIHHSIPVMENILFALALLRSRTIENMTEGRAILEKILPFQSHGIEESEGHFPIYLHEYPVCLERGLGIQLLVPFYWILKQFGHVLGAALKGKLEEVIEKLLQYAQKTQSWKPLSYSNQVRLAAALIAFGKLLGKGELQQQGEKDLVHLAGSLYQEEWCSTAALADIYAALQMVYPTLSGTPWKDFKSFLEKSWHPYCHAYIGPCIKEQQEGFEPRPGLYDLLMGYFTHSYAERTKKLDIYHLQAALIQPNENSFDFFRAVEEKGHYKGEQWVFIKGEKKGYSLLEKKGPISPFLEKTYTPLRFVWGTGERTHTLVCQNSNAKIQDYHHTSKKIEIIFDLEEPEESEEREKQKEICLYADLFEGCQMRLNNQPSMTFEIGQEVQLIAGSQVVFLLKFEVIEGEGQFLGHFMRGNRPSQQLAKGERRYDAYDCHLFLRTVRRQGKCRLRLLMSEACLI